MVLQSGVPPYEYAIRGRRFESMPIPIGLSGILLEQAQFVVTAEYRKWIGNDSILPTFLLYTHPNVAPSGPYEPKSIGTTLDNVFNPVGAFFVDNIYEIRAALNDLWNIMYIDTDMANKFEYRQAWLQALYPESPSGFITGFDSQESSTTDGHWRHRFPSESGIIAYALDEVLGSSGVLYDIDFAEVMFNPGPHISRIGFDDMHGKLSSGGSDSFLVQQFPIWPAFQRTDGSLVTLTGREPATLPGQDRYETANIGSGYHRLDGYALDTLTEVLLSTGLTFGSTVAFTNIVEGLRAPTINNIESSVLYMDASAQSSGVYRLAAVNRFSDFPNTTIESGIFSHWPLIRYYAPSDGNVGSTTTKENAGYHVFDDCLWMTDISSSSSIAGPNFGYPSGLAILSPHTGHRLWITYAEQNAVSVSTLSPGVLDFNWSTMRGLERTGLNSIYRVVPRFQRSTTTSSGQLKFAQYNDSLDFVSATTTTSTHFSGNDEFPLGGGTANAIHDMWFDGTYYWVSAAQFVGLDIWKFDSSLQYVTKYVCNSPSGIHNARGAYLNGQNHLFYGVLAGTTLFAGSGIFPMNVVTDGTNPFANDANPPGVGEIDISFATAKYINGAPLLGVATFAEIMDIIEVSSSTHVKAGIYAIVSFTIGGSTRLYLLRIEETSTSWEIVAITRMETGVGSFMRNRELLYMSY